MLYRLLENHLLKIIIFILCIKQSFERFVSEKDHEQINRVSKDYFEERGLILDDLENPYEQGMHDADSDISVYFQQPSSLLYSVRNIQLHKKIEPQVFPQQNVQIPSAVSQDKFQQYNQERLLQQIQQYKDELQSLRMPKVSNFANNHIVSMQSNLKIPQFQSSPNNILPMLNDNQKDIYNQKYMDNLKQQQQYLPMNFRQPVYK